MNKSFRFFIKLSFYKFVEHFISIFWKKFCFLSLTSKPKSCYEKIRNCNILRLPTTRLLRDYKNFITLHTGFPENSYTRITVRKEFSKDMFPFI